MHGRRQAIPVTRDISVPVVVMILMAILDAGGRSKGAERTERVAFQRRLSRDRPSWARRRLSWQSSWAPGKWIRWAKKLVPSEAVSRNSGRQRAELADRFLGSTRECPSSQSATVSGGIAGCRHLSTFGVLPLCLLQYERAAYRSSILCRRLL